MMKMRLFTRKDGVLVYGTGYLYRIIMFFFAAALLIGASRYSSEDWFSWFSFPVFLALFLIAAGLYTDSWTFDKVNGVIISRFGLIGLNRKRIFKMENVSSLSLTHFSKGYQEDRLEGKRRRFSEFLVFSLITDEGIRRDIEIVREARSAGTTERAAQTIADYCGLELDKDRDQDPNLSTNFLGNRSRNPFR